MNIDIEFSRRELRKAIPELGRRIFDLGGKHYNGCGFHWGLEYELGCLLKGLNNFDAPMTEIRFSILQSCYRSLVASVEKAEKSVV